MIIPVNPPTRRECDTTTPSNHPIRRGRPVTVPNSRPDFYLYDHAISLCQFSGKRSFTYTS